MKRKTGGLPYWKRDGSVIFLLADGIDTDYTLTYPRLAAHDWPAMSLLVTSLVDGVNRLTTAQVQELDLKNWDMSLHGYTHTDPTTLPDDADGVAPWDAGSLHEQLYEGRLWLRNAGIVNGIRHYSPPIGFSEHVSDVARTFGVLSVFFPALPAGTVLPQPYTYHWQRCADSQATMDELRAALVQNVYRRPFHVSFWLLERVVNVAAPGQTSVTRLEAIIQLLRDWDITPTTLSTLMRRI